ncbi:MAG TPA: DUF427 domain-containing protein [Microlunatus sp.]|nr:DUF427 domain-containing protein [Microlunatus sp.]
MRTELSERWVRGWIGDLAVVDARGALLFWEDDFPVPNYAFEPADVRTDLLQQRSGPPTGIPWFFGPHGPVSVWYDLVLADRRIPGVAWERDDPAVAGRIIVCWAPGLLDRWTEEDEQVAGHPRDPHHRVDALHSSRHVVVSLDGRLLGETRDPVLLFETNVPTRYYLPEADLVAEALEPSRARSQCPYKGTADRYWSIRGVPDASDVAWSYSDPFPAVGAIAGRVAFYNELVDFTVDGVDLPRAVSVFSRREHRPAAG